MSKHNFHFPLAVLTYNAGLLHDALVDVTIGPPILTRISEAGFLTRFTTLSGKTVTNPATKASQVGDTGTLTIEQNAAVAEMRRLTSAARRSAGLGLKGNHVALRQEFLVGNASGHALSDEIADATLIQASAVKYATELGLHGWTAGDATLLHTAIVDLSGVDLSQEATKKSGLTLTQLNAADANQLYTDCLTIENAARLQFPSTTPGNETTRARYLIGIFPPHGHNPPPAPPAPPAPPTP